MTEIKALKSTIDNKFRDMKITTKMVLCYFIVLFIPITGLAVYYYYQISYNLLESYSVGSQNVLERSYNNYKLKLSQLESISLLFQQNTAVVDYLSGNSSSVADEMYSYLKDVGPLFPYVIKSYPLLKDIGIYRFTSSFTHPQYYISDDWKYSTDKNEILRLGPSKGVWKCVMGSGSSLSFRYYEKLYNHNYSKEIGIFTVEAKPQILQDSFSIKEKSTSVIFLLKNRYLQLVGGTLKELSGQQITALELDRQKGSRSYLNRFGMTSLVNTVELPEIDAKAYLITRFNSFTSRDIVLFVVCIILLLLLITAIYYIIVSSIVQHITGLVRHIKSTRYDHDLKEYQASVHGDEIGVLVQSFNMMIRRINQLISSVHQTETKKREADYYALQAQIKPHFLFNTLENIRMMAQLNRDNITAEMAQYLGQFVRYNIAKDKNDVFITEEIEHIENYLKIFKTRIGSSFSYTIDVKTDIKGFKCPRFILQPIVENSMDHGLKAVRGEKKILLSIDKDEDSIIITIADNGSGITQKRLSAIIKVMTSAEGHEDFATKGNGIGILNVNQRLKMYYGVSCGITIKSKNGVGTECTLKLGQNKGQY